MALIDLSLVTKTLVGLLATRLRASTDWPSGAQPDGGAALDASPAPPDLVNADRALSFYLYHVREDAHTKSQDWEVSDVNVPKQFKPMGLTLYYVLCPRSNMSTVADRTYAEQLIMGLAVKTLHDFPIIDDSTVMIDRSAVEQPVLDYKLRNRGNRLRIELQPTPYNEAAQFWQAGSQPLRMAAYYEVNAVLIEPEVAKSRRTRVSMVGVHPVLRGQPLIEGTRNLLIFSVPGQSDPRSAECSPAEVAPGGIMEIFGADLKGDDTVLLMSHTDFDEPIPVDAAWAITSNGSVMQVKVQDKIVTSGGDQPILPGVYGATVRTTMRSQLPDGTQRDFDNFSNEAPFVVAPKVTVISALAGDLSGSITVAGFVPALITGGSVALFAGAIPPDSMDRSRDC